MKRMQFVWLFAALLGVLTLASCSNDEGEQWGKTDSEMADRLVGTWHCTSQQWAEGGDSETASYAPSAACAMTFNATFTGSMAAGDDYLFELRSNHNFMWYVRQDKGRCHLVTNICEGDQYQILKLTDRELVMKWEDDGYSITCHFERAE